MSLINTLKSGVTLKIINAQGQKDSVNIQPKGKITLPAGWSLDPAFTREYQSYVINSKQTQPTPTAQPTQTQTHQKA